MTTPSSTQTSTIARTTSTLPSTVTTPDELSIVTGVGEPCEDLRDWCPLWKANGECNSDTNGSIMRRFCRGSCGFCGDSTGPPPDGTTTSDSGTTTTAPSDISTVECVDNHELCAIWAGNGECRKNPSFMLEFCLISCGLCGSADATAPMTTEESIIGRLTPVIGRTTTSTSAPTTTATTSTAATTTITTTTQKSTTVVCEDLNEACPVWKGFGECEKNPSYMLGNCLVSCGVCVPAGGNGSESVNTTVATLVATSAVVATAASPATTTAAAPSTVLSTVVTTTGPCVDTNEVCGLWAQTGQCELNPEYMLNNCPRACGVCGTEETTVTSANDDGSGELDGSGDVDGIFTTPEVRVTTEETTSAPPPPPFTPIRTTTEAPPAGTTAFQITSPATCIDANEYCEYWAGINECEKNPLYMLSHCLVSCGVCDPQDTKPETTPMAPGTTTSAIPSTPERTTTATAAPSTPQRMTPTTTTSFPTTVQSTTATTATTTTLATTTTRTCVDENDLCDLWAATGQCEANPSYMLEWCRKACGICVLETNDTTTTTNMEPTTEEGSVEIGSGDVDEFFTIPKARTTTRKPPATTSEVTTSVVTFETTTMACVDENDLCALWAGTGQCEANPSYMLLSCRRSCQVCFVETETTPSPFIDEGSGDIDPTLGPPVTEEDLGEVGSGEVDTLFTTPDSEGTPFTTVPTTTTAVPCVDNNDLCPLWARDGHCEDNPSYMLENCRISCGLCVVENTTTSEGERTYTKTLGIYILARGTLSKMCVGLNASPFAKLHPRL